MRNAVTPLLNWHRYAVNVRFVPARNEINGKEVILKIGESLNEERFCTWKMYKATKVHNNQIVTLEVYLHQRWDDTYQRDEIMTSKNVHLNCRGEEENWLHPSIAMQSNL